MSIEIIEREKAESRISGICFFCKERPTIPNSFNCDECRKENLLNRKERHAKRKALGQCIVCRDKVVEGRVSCQRCLNKQREINKKAKIKAFEHYGSKCACCGEEQIEFLTIDHVNNDGARQRSGIGLKCGGHGFYKWLIRNNFPTEFELQILCWNCNCAKQHNGGVCPHKKQIKRKKAR